MKPTLPEQIKALKRAKHEAAERGCLSARELDCLDVITQRLERLYDAELLGRSKRKPKP